MSRWLCLEELVENRTSLPSRTLARPTHYFSPWREKRSFASLLKCEMRDMSLALFRFLTTWRIASILFLMSNEDFASHPETDWKTAFSFGCGTFTYLLFICSLFIFVLKKQNKKAQNNNTNIFPCTSQAFEPTRVNRSGRTLANALLHGSFEAAEGVMGRTEGLSVAHSSQHLSRAAISVCV